MANGILGRENLNSTTNTVLYTVPVSTFAVITVNIANRSSNAAEIRLAISDTGTPDDADYIEYDTELAGNGSVERGGIVVDAEKNIVVYANSGDISAVAYGIETPTS